MGNKREIKGILHAVLSSFISRNNDVDGYWGIGKLYAHMYACNLYTVKIDLLNKTIEPYDEQFEKMIKEYVRKLNRYIHHKKLSNDDLKKAELNLTAFSNDCTPSFKNFTPHRMSCEFTIENNLDRKYSHTMDVYCRMHNPKTELRSSRVYSNECDD